MHIEFSFSSSLRRQNKINVYKIKSISPNQQNNNHHHIVDQFEIECDRVKLDYYYYC